LTPGWAAPKLVSASSPPARHQDVPVQTGCCRRRGRARWSSRRDGPDRAYPSKPITIVVGFTPGGISDVLARALGQRLSVQMGQSVIVENKPGAATTIASAYVANAPADGYTLYFQDMTSHAIAAAAYKKLKFDSWNDFSLVTLVASTPLMLVTSKASNAKDLKTLVAQGKAARSRCRMPRRATAPSRTWPARPSTSWWASTPCTCRTRVAPARPRP
jgi:hypothetical protein